MAMTVVTAISQYGGNPTEGFHHPEANFVQLVDGHLVLWTHASGSQVAVYPPKTWVQVYEGETVDHRTDVSKFLKAVS